MFHAVGGDGLVAVGIERPDFRERVVGEEIFSLEVGVARAVIDEAAEDVSKDRLPANVAPLASTAPPIES